MNRRGMRMDESLFFIFQLGEKRKESPAFNPSRWEMLKIVVQYPDRQLIISCYAKCARPCWHAKVS